MKYLCVFLLFSVSYASAMNNAIIPLHDVDRDSVVANKAFDTYFRNSEESIHVKDLKPYIKEVVQEVRKNSPSLDEDSILDKLESGFINMRSEKDVDQLNTIIAKAIDKAFESQKNESNKKWTKKQSAYLAAATSILSSVITLTAFLVSASGAKQCGS